MSNPRTYRHCTNRGPAIGKVKVAKCKTPPTVFACTIYGKCTLIKESGRRAKAIQASGITVCETCPNATMNLKDYFAEAHCVTLKRRPDRWERFISNLPADWPFAEVQRFDAIDGQRCKHPAWWKQGGGAWGCYRSHLRLIEDAINRGVESILLLEDDALFPEGFTQKVEAFLAAVPSNWGMIYLGGQHLMADKNPPKKINQWVYQPYNVNRTHAFALRGDTLREVYKHLNATKDWHGGNHIDHHLGRFHQRRDPKYPVYCPKEWLVGQAEGKSNISGRTPPDRFWKSAEEIARAGNVDTLPFVAVIGLHSSGSSCLAGVLYHLGLHLGNNLGGYYGSNPDKSCGFEAKGLEQICETAIPFPATDYAKPRQWIFGNLKKWINDRRREAANRGTLAGGKYPMLCRMGNQLLNICGDQLRVIHIDRPLEESIASLVKRTNKDPSKIVAHQTWLAEGKEQLLRQVPEDRQLTVTYANLLSDPATIVDQLTAFLGISPKEEQRQKAVAWPKPEKRHF